MKRKHFGIIVFITAFFISGCAAYYSVFGLSKLFAGAALQVTIMASSLEFAKLVSASLLQRYWKELDIFKRVYLSIATVLLILITSAGIYGFLSNAYQITANKDSILEKRVGVLDLKKSRFSERYTEVKTERDQVVASITELRKSLSTSTQNQYLDKKSGQIITTTSNSARKTFETQLDDATKRRDFLSSEINSVADSISSYEVAIIDAKSSSDVGSELGPLKYLSGLTGKPMDSVVNWFLILIIFIFDPLAIVLLTTANYLVGKKDEEPSVDAPLPQTELVPDDVESEPKHIVIQSSVNPNEIFTWEPIIQTSNPVDIVSGSVIDTGSYIRYETGENHDGTYTDPISTIDTGEQEIPVIVVREQPRKIFDQNMSDKLAQTIRKALPWWKPNDSGSMEEVSGSNDPEILSERQLNNMTHQEVQNWYRKQREVRDS